MGALLSVRGAPAEVIRGGKDDRWNDHVRVSVYSGGKMEDKRKSVTNARSDL